MERVLVLGGCGAGKSVFARRLGALIDAPVVHLDQEYFLPGWVEPDPAQWLMRLDEIISGPRWVIDGSHMATLARRLTKADTAIVLDLPTWLCVFRVFRRIVSTYGRVRFDMAPGCPEHPDPQFIWYAATFRRRQHPRVLGALTAFSGDVIALRSRAAIEGFLRGVTPKP
jgi:adenylate kinase family enzyme